jgi:glycosyltransferase involved in cell wall biosynthesis
MRVARHDAPWVTERGGGRRDGKLHRLPIAIFLTSFDPGGTERQMIELILRLPPARFDVHVACLHRRGAWLPRVEASGATATEFPIRGFFTTAAIAQLRTFSAWLRERRIQVLQTCDYYTNVFGLAGGVLARVPVRIASRRDVNPGRTRSRLALQRVAYHMAHHVVANSRAARRALVHEGVPQRRILVIPNGIDAPDFAARRPRRPIRTVITVANLRPEKDHRTLLAAASIVTAKYPDICFRVVGDGALRAELERETAARGLGDRVEFLGHREDVPALLAESDLFAFPSRTEAFPNGVLEGMAAGLPVVACAVEGLLDLVDDGRTGILVPPGDPAAVAAAIERLVTNQPLATRIAAEARAQVAARYSFDAMVASFEALYLRAAGGEERLPTHRGAVRRVFS